MKTRYIFLAFAALAMSACARNVEPAEPESVQVTVTASLEGNDLTRTTVQDGGTQVYWETGEEIKVFFRNSIGRFISQNTELARTADFTGAFSAVVGSNEGEASSHLIWGLYPFRADATYDGSSVTTTLPSAQTGRAGSFAKNTNITIAQSVGLNLAFYNVCGGLRFSLTQEGIKRITFEGNNGEALAGKIKIAFEDGVPVVSEVVAKDSVLTLTAPNGGTFQTGVWYYLSAIPGTLSGGYKMVFYKESESAKLTSTSSVRIKRGIFGSLADADEDLVFKPTGGGDEPNPEDFIQFKDPIAKYACVEKFDTNGDGEISYAEAAAVTTLEGLFNDWNTVTEFDEIQYFTSVTSTSGVFNGLPHLKHITIPDNITTLGTFRNCSALDTVKLPAALTSLPMYCFDGCFTLKSVTLPTGITSIPNNAFRGCAALESLVVPSTVTSVGQYAFDGCTVLTGVDLPSGLKTIGNYAFRSCQAIASMDFPASITSIGSGAFSGCTSLTEVTLRNSVSLDSYAFSGCSSLASVVLPEDMTFIPDYCFQNCIALATIIWPNSLTTIGDYAFNGCRFADAGYALYLPSTITTIGCNAFDYLHHLVLPSTSTVLISSNSFIVNYTFLYVPADMVEMYKVRTNWSNYADQIRPISDYPVTFTVGGSVGEAVDLGLSVKWASWNVGASAPEDYGAYFAWGETEPTYWDYNWSTYRWSGTGLNSTVLTKYNTKSANGKLDNKTTLDLEDDAARANWGGTWRMPTEAECTELRDNCSWAKSTLNGISGVLITSTNGNSIFIPAAGYRYYRTYLDNVGSSAYFWSSSLNTDEPFTAFVMHFYSYKETFNFFYGDRFNGFSVRPVCPKD